jgi:hypothetical protein
MATSKKPETKKTAAKNAADKKTADKKPVDKKPDENKLSDDFPKAYIRLRTVLDALEVGIIQRCLREESASERVKRAEEMEAWLIPIIDKLKIKTSKPPYTSCAEGYYNCGGVCVPYQCPTDR